MNLERIVCHKLDGIDTEVLQHVYSRCVIAGIVGQTQESIGVNCVMSTRLQAVRQSGFSEADAVALRDALVPASARHDDVL